MSIGDGEVSLGIRDRRATNEVELRRHARDEGAEEGGLLAEGLERDESAEDAHSVTVGVAWRCAVGESGEEHWQELVFDVPRCSFGNFGKKFEDFVAGGVGSGVSA